MKELYSKILREIYDIEHISSEKLKSLLAADSAVENVNSVIIFFENFGNIDEQLEYKKLFFNFPDLKVHINFLM